MTAWLLWCSLLAGTLGSGSWAAERTLRAAGRPARGVWAAALLLSAALPLASLALRPDAPLPSAFPVELVSTMDASALAPMVAEAAPAPGSGWLDAVDWESLLLLGWGAASTGVLLWLAGSSAGLALRRRRWRRDSVDGVPVLVSASTGPAVVGALRPRIVLPEWALAEPPEARRLMVAHEAEHLRAGDPRLLLAGLLCAAAAPWNPLVWWQLRRLRAAVEVDCDARVLAGGADLRAYATLLIEVGRRASAVRLPAAALAARPSLLERRIRTMTSRTERARRRAGLLVVPCAAAALAAAAHAPEAPDVEGVFASAVGMLGPREPQPEVVEPLDVPVAVEAWRAAASDELGIGRLQRIFERHRPASLRATDVFARIDMTVDADGAARNVKVLDIVPTSAEPALHRALRELRFDRAPASGRPPLEGPFTLQIEFPAPEAPADGERAQTVYDVAAVDRRPQLRNPSELMREAEESYPPLLRDAGITGRVTVEMVVDPRGATREVRVVEAARDEFGAAARTALRNAEWTPAEVDGRPVAVRFSFPVQFTLGSRASSRRGTAVGGDTVPQALLAEIRRRHPEVAAGRAPDAPLVVVRTEDGRIVESFFGSSDEMNERIEPSRIAHIDVFKGSRVAGVGLPEGLIVITRGEPRGDGGRTIRTRGDAGVPSALLDALRSRHPGLFSGGGERGSLLVVESAGGAILDSFAFEGVASERNPALAALDPDQIERVEVLKSSVLARLAGRDAPDLIRVTLKPGVAYRPGALF